MKTIVERLLPGADLKAEILRLCQENQIISGTIISAVGSLTQAQLRFADGKGGTSIKGPFEICSATGTCSIHGIHIHISISDRIGNTVGGHLLEGCRINTTCEIIILEVDGYEFFRKPDSETGYLELFPQKI